MLEAGTGSLYLRTPEHGTFSGPDASFLSGFGSLLGFPNEGSRLEKYTPWAQTTGQVKQRVRIEADF